MSVTPVSNIPVSVNYTGRDYYALREQIITRIQERLPNWTAADPADFGVAFVEGFSYMGDVLAYYIDRAANETNLATATQRDSLLNIAQNYGYIPSGYRQAYVDLTFTNTSGNIVTIPQGTIVTGDVIVNDTINIETVRTIAFTTDTEIDVPAQVGSTPGTNTVSASEGRYVTRVSTNANSFGELVGVSDGSPDMSFELGENPVVDGSVEVYVQDGDVYSKWTSVQHLLDYGPLDLVYSTFTDANNIVYIQFGDGVSGAIPVNYSEIRANYVVGGGIAGNVAASSLDTLEYVPGLNESQTTALSVYIKVTNASGALGGSDPESNDQIRYSAPTSLRALNRAVTLEDFKSLALSVTNVGKAQATASTWTSVTLYIAPSRNANDTDPAPGLDELGNPTAEFDTMEADVTTFLQDKTLIGTSVTIQPPTYVDAVVTIQYAKLSQYTTAEVEKGIKDAVLTYFGYSNLNFKDTIYPQDIEFVVQQVAGVKTAKVSGLHRESGSGIETLQGDDFEIFRFTEANTFLAAI